MRTVVHLFVILMVVGIWGCNTGRVRVENPELVVPETPVVVEPSEPQDPVPIVVERYVVLRGENDVEVQHYLNNILDFVYMRFLPSHEAYAELYECVAARGDDIDGLPTVVTICVDHERNARGISIAIIIENDEGEQEEVPIGSLDCSEVENREVCEDTQDDFDAFRDRYGQEIDRRIDGRPQGEI